MNTFWKVGVAFVAGLAIGAIATKKYIEYKEDLCEEVSYEESEEVMEEENTNNDNHDNNEGQTQEINKVDYNNVIRSVDDDRYQELLQDLKYKVEAQEVPEYELQRHILDEDVDRTKPYNISPNDFEDIDAYESDEYTLYADGYVTDSYGMPVSEEDVMNTLGDKFESYFGIYDNDQIYVRNERLQMDFSVIRDLDNFEDVASPRIKRMVGLQ